jgi:hypothetical protein
MNRIGIRNRKIILNAEYAGKENLFALSALSAVSAFKSYLFLYPC